jgi:hypothetical protein
VLSLRLKSNNSWKRTHRKANYNFNRNYEKPNPSGNRPRARYFPVFRPERTALSILENTYSTDSSHKVYRANRFLYYVVLRHLATCLWYPPDRVRLQHVEHDLHNQMLLHCWQRGPKLEPNRVSLWLFRPNKTIVDGLQQKL